MIKTNDYVRRHSRLHEVILLSFIFQLLFGSFLLYFTSSLYKADWNIIYSWDNNSKNSLIGSIFAFCIAALSLRKMFRYPGSQSVSFVLPTVTISFLFPILIYWLNRIDYSIQILIICFLVTAVWCYGGYFIGNRYRLNRYAVIPLGETLDFQNTHNAIFEILEVPDIIGQRYNAIIADFQALEMTADWERFLANCTLSRIPVYHSRRIKESLTGRVKIDRLSENEFGALLPSSFYEKMKRIIDFLFAIILLPFFIPFFIVVGIAIKIESKGPIFFIQKRMGFRGHIFSMIKFRSMLINRKGGEYTQVLNDPRITKVGKIIRKFRIDELPQILNVLVGQMSFIGPRPESLELSLWYEKDVPFFRYRHVVRPGISGWAQVEQGYAAEVDAMKLKLEYDFYYIKHFSLWLDILITFKTVKTILNGFGSR